MYVIYLLTWLKRNAFHAKQYHIISVSQQSTNLNYKRYYNNTDSFCRGHQFSSDIKQFIIEHTEVTSKTSLTPEIQLRLFTPNCKFWYARPELWPFSDPYWAIYWPGGQVLARYLLDNPGLARCRKVLDLGSGCGASAIAARMCEAASVVASDIDPVAAVATALNCDLNGVGHIACTTEDLIGSEPKEWDLILLGDMFYEESTADRLQQWLRTCIRTHGTQVLIGDPGRAHLESHAIRRHLKLMAEFQLPPCVRQENFGLTSGYVWLYEAQQ